jgi:hypothetical protein
VQAIRIYLSKFCLVCFTSGTLAVMYEIAGVQNKDESN